MGTPPLLMAAMVGVSGHMGTRAISIFESWMARKLNLPAENPESDIQK